MCALGTQALEIFSSYVAKIDAAFTNDEMEVLIMANNGLDLIIKNELETCVELHMSHTYPQTETAQKIIDDLIIFLNGLLFAATGNCRIKRYEAVIDSDCSHLVSKLMDSIYQLMTGKQ